MVRDIAMEDISENAIGFTSKLIQVLMSMVQQLQKC